jgi:hypothetical protein
MGGWYVIDFINEACPDNEMTKSSGLSILPVTESRLVFNHDNKPARVASVNISVGDQHWVHLHEAFHGQRIFRVEGYIPS